MKLAWFRPDTPPLLSSLDENTALLAELSSTHEIELFTAANAHRFAEQHTRTPYDLFVYELEDTPAHSFIWPYLLHYGGVLHLRSLTLHLSRAATLLGAQRGKDYATEFRFNHGAWPELPRAAPPAYPGDWPMLRIPVLAAQVVVVSQPSTVDELKRAHPEVLVRHARTGIGANPNTHDDKRKVPATPENPGTLVKFGCLSGHRLEVVRRAMARAQHAGAFAELMTDLSPERLLQHADVIVSLPWPSRGESQTPALAAMAAGKPAIVFESAASAEWPVLDPQTWQLRSHGTDTPISVSIDPRDEEHSLVLAIRRLSAEPALRAKLGRAAHNWWRTHATPELAANDWHRILKEAVHLPAPSRPADWPAHLTADVTMRELEVLHAQKSTDDVLLP